MAKLKLCAGLMPVSISGTNKLVSQKEIEVSDVRKAIKDILRERMKMLKKKITEQELFGGGMPEEDAYYEFWSSPMEAVEEVWQELQEEEKIVDVGDFFRIGASEVSLYGKKRKIFKKVEVEQVKKKEITEERKQELKDALAKMVLENNGEFPEDVKDVAKLPGVGFSSELLKVFKSYDGIKVAAMTAYREQYVEKPKGKPGRKPQFEKEEAISRIRKFFEANGRLPKALECKIDPELPNWKLITNYLGPREEWWKVLGLPEELCCTDRRGGQNKRLNQDDVASKPEVEIAKKVINEKPETCGKEQCNTDSNVKEQCNDSNVKERCGIDSNNKEQCNIDSNGSEIQISIKVPGQKKPIVIIIPQ